MPETLRKKRQSLMFIRTGTFGRFPGHFWTLSLFLRSDVIMKWSCLIPLWPQRVLVRCPCSVRLFPFKRRTPRPRAGPAQQPKAGSCSVDRSPPSAAPSSHLWLQTAVIPSLSLGRVTLSTWQKLIRRIPLN